MIPLATKDLGIEAETGLPQRAIIYQFTVDVDVEIVSVNYRIETLSPTGVVVKISEPKTYTRYNAPAVLDAEGVEITPAKMKFNALRDSQLGIGIMGMLQSTLNNYPVLLQE